MANDIIGFDDLFDFNADTPIDKGLEGIERLSKAYKNFVDSLQGRNNEIRQSMNGLSGELGQLETKLRGLNIANEKGRNDASAIASQVSKQTKQYSDLKIKLQEQVTKTREMSKELRNLERSYKLLSKTRAKEAADSKKIATRQAQSDIAIAERAAKKQLAIEERLAKQRISLAEAAEKAKIASSKKEADAVIANAQRAVKAEQRAAEKSAAIAARRGRPGSINDLSAQRDEAIGNFKNMGAGIPDFVRQDQINNINQLSRSLQDAQAAMILARKGAIVARDSYAGLVQENARLVKQLREMPGAFNTATGEINKHNKAAVNLQRQYRQNTDALKKFDSGLGLNQRNVGNYKTAMAGAAKNMNQFALGLAGQFAGMIALADATRVAFQSNLELSDGQAAVQKTVGLTKREVDELAESFKDLDTRTTLNGLFDIAKIGGQFGVAAKDIEEFTVAADKAAVALSDEFKGGVEEVATELYTLRGLFDETNDLSPGIALERIGSAINSLGASGAATGPVIAEFAKRLGQLGNMGPSIQDALGLGAALQELGLSAEIASGGYSNIIIQLQQTKNADKAAKFLGVTTDAFREMLANDPNELILNMATNLAKMKNGTEVMRTFGIMSQESIKVFNTLGSNVERVREQQAVANREFEKGTSIAKEFAIVNDTLAASWEKLYNTMLNSVTSGAIGNFLKGQIDIFRNAFTEVEKYFNHTRDAARESARIAGVIEKENEALEASVVVFRKLSKQQNLTTKDKEALRLATLRIKSTLGDNVIQINKETGAWEENTSQMEEALKARKALQTNSSSDFMNKLDANEEQLSATRGNKQRIKDNLEVLESGFSNDPQILDSAKGGSAIGFWQQRSRYNEEQQHQLKEISKLWDELKVVEAEELKLIEDRNEALAIAKGLGIDLAAAEKARNRARIIGSEHPEHTDPEEKKDFNPETAGADVVSDKAKEMERLAERAREARHELERLNQENRVMNAEWRLEDTPEGLVEDRIAAEQKVVNEKIRLAEKEAAWKLRLVSKGSEAEKMIRRDLALELKQIEDTRQAPESYMYEIKRVYDEQSELARINAEERRRHNEAGADGIILIEAQLQRDLDRINREREKAQEAMLAKMEANEKATAQRIHDVWSKNLESDREARKAHAENVLEIAKRRVDANSTYDRDVAIAENAEKQKQDALEATWGLAQELSGSFFEMRQNDLQREYDIMTQQREQELEAAGDNAELRFQIEEKYKAKELKLRQKMARAEKMQAMFSIAINTAKAIVQALGNPFMVAIVAAIGAAQLAAVASRPIPQFYRGVKSAPEGLAKVAETGPELAISPDGRITRYEKPETVYLEKGTEIKTASQTTNYEKTILRQSERLYSDNQSKALVESFDNGQRLILSQNGVSDSGFKTLSRDFRNYAGRIEAAVSKQNRVIVNQDGSTRESNGRIWNNYVNQKYFRK